MNKKLKYGFVFVICLFFVFVLTGCSSGGQTYTELESKLKDAQLDALKTEVRNYVDAEKLGLSETETEAINAVLVTVNSELATNFDVEKTEELLKTALGKVYNAVPTEKQSLLVSIDDQTTVSIKNHLDKTIEKAIELAYNYTTKKAQCQYK